MKGSFSKLEHVFFKLRKYFAAERDKTKSMLRTTLQVLPGLVV